MSSRSGLDASLRRIKPEKHRKALVARTREELPFLAKAARTNPKLLLDTTVYIDALQGRTPETLDIAPIWESLALQRHRGRVVCTGRAA